MQNPLPQVDFYILPDATPAQSPVEQRALFACRLIEKIHKLRHRIYVNSNDAQQAQLLDELLWRHQPASFIPHELAGAPRAAAGADTSTVQLVWSGEAGGMLPGEAGDAIGETAGGNAVLINLADGVPAFFDRFARVSEIVVQTPEILAATRAAWRYYQQRGCTLERHDLRARR